jgi:hypothetical protein
MIDSILSIQTLLKRQFSFFRLVDWFRDGVLGGMALSSHLVSGDLVDVSAAQDGLDCRATRRKQ